MAEILIKNKKYACSETIKDEIEWLNIKIDTAVRLVKIIEEKQEELDKFTRTKQSEIQDLINQLKSIRD